MQKIHLVGSDLGILCLGRQILKRQPTAEIIFEKDENALPDVSLDQLCMQNILSQSRWGRVMVLVDQRNQALFSHWSQFAWDFDIYIPQDKRAQNSPQIKIQSTPVLHSMAEEGWGKSVEFNRIARKYIRIAKSHCVDTLFWPELIYGEESTLKNLQRLAGSQIRVLTPALLYQVPESSSPHRDLKFIGSWQPWEEARFESILRTKISKGSKTT